MDEGVEDFTGDLINSEDEDTTDERKHNQLLDAISALDGKKKKQLSQRTVISNQISEFNFSSSKDDGSKVNLSELVGSLKESGRLGDLKKQLKSVRNHKQTVSAPLPKHEKEKIDRSTAYETISEDVSKWDPIVRQNRRAEQLHFPLQKQDFKVITTDQLVKRFTPRTPLEVQVAAMLQGSENVIQNPQDELTPAEQRALRAMDLDEAKERRLELMKHRALLSYKETKAKRQKKIKSKRYRRILKKEKLKTESKQLETLRQEDPEEFLEKMKQFERDRAEERASLKHRGGSKYAKRQMIYAKYDDRARQEVQDMLQKSREITAKLVVESDDDDQSDDNTTTAVNQSGGDIHYSATEAGNKNPWMAKPTATIKLKEFSRPEEVVNQEKDDQSEDDDDDDESGDKGEGKPVFGKSVILLNEKAKDGNLDVVDEDNDVKGASRDVIDDIFESSKEMTGNAERKLKGKNKGKKNKETSVKQGKGTNQKPKGKNKGKKNKDTKETSIKGKAKQVTAVKQDKETNEKALDEAEEEGDDSNDDEMISEGLVRKRTLEEVETLADEEKDDQSSKSPAKKRKVEKKKRKQKAVQEIERPKTEKPKEAFIDPKKMFTMESKMRQVGHGPTIIDNDEDDIDAEEQQRMTIAQAFADDDVIEEFTQEKGDMIEKGKPQDIDLTLPGWGDWGGQGLKVSKRKRKRFTIKAPPPLPRKDEHLGHVILNEKKLESVKKHQVSEIPFPYRNADQFEKSIQTPLGRTWNPESVYKELVKPKVVTHMGKIITPIDKAEVFKDKQKNDDIGNKDKNETDKFKRSKKDNKKHKGKSKGKRK